MENNRETLLVVVTSTVLSAAVLALVIIVGVNPHGERFLPADGSSVDFSDLAVNLLIYYFIILGFGVITLWIYYVPIREYLSRRRAARSQPAPPPIPWVERLISIWATIVFLPFVLAYHLLRAFFLLLHRLYKWSGIKLFKSAPRLEGGEKAGWAPSSELPAGVVRLRAWMRRLAESTFLFVGAPENPGFSKLGGRPDLPRDVAWPHATGHPLQFLLQVDLSELPRRKGGPDWLPDVGRLYGFLDPDRDADRVKVLYTIDPPAPIAIGEQPVPEKRVSFRRFKSAPSMDWLGAQAFELNRENPDIDLREQAAGVTQPSFGGVTHRIGGYPDEIQGDCMRVLCERISRGLPEYGKDDEPVPPEIEAGSKDWRLLLQIDSDDELGWSWCDAGMLYVFVRREDAKRGDFSRVVTLEQFY